MLAVAAVAVVLVLLWLRSGRSVPGVAAPAAPAPQGDALAGLDGHLEAKARIEELELLARAQARINLQRRADLLAKAYDGVKPAPKAE